MSLVRVLLALFLLAGCAAEIQRQQWAHPAKSDQDFYRDKYECERENFIGRTRAGVLIFDWVRVRDCMRARGWVGQE